MRNDATLRPNWILDFRGVCYHCSQMRPSGRIELSTKQIPESRIILSSRTWLKTEHCPREISADVDLEDCLFLLKHGKKEVSKYCLRPGYIFRWLKKLEKWGVGRCMGVCVCVCTHVCMLDHIISMNRWELTSSWPPPPWVYKECYLRMRK